VTPDRRKVKKWKKTRTTFGRSRFQTVEKKRINTTTYKQGVLHLGTQRKTKTEDATGGGKSIQQKGDSTTNKKTLPFVSPTGKPR